MFQHVVLFSVTPESRVKFVHSKEFPGKLS